jgi:hypothetical protein
MNSPDVVRELQTRLAQGHLWVLDRPLAEIIIQLAQSAPEDLATAWTSEMLNALVLLNEANRTAGVARLALTHKVLPTHRTPEYLTESPTLRIVNQELPESCVQAVCRQLLIDRFSLHLSEQNLRERLPFNAFGGRHIDHLDGALNALVGEFGLLVVFGTGTAISATAGHVIPMKALVMRNPGGVIATIHVAGRNHAVIVDEIVNGIVHLRDPFGVHGPRPSGCGCEATMSESTFQQVWQATGCRTIIAWQQGA